jgi:CRP/FNR family transcriptional regulator, cyclic AMP receptor protein
MRTILLIEDNDDIRDSMAEILELSNYYVLVAENGKIGIEKAIQNHPDLIICDIMMPALDGYAVLHAVQKNNEIKNTPFIFLTAKTERDDYRKAMDLGADDYITKPFSFTELLNSVDSRLRKFNQLKLDLTPELQAIIQVSLEKDGLQSLTENRHINKYKKKQTVYSEGNYPNRLYYVVKGKVKAYKINGEGKELVTDLYSAGDFLGHIALLEGAAYKDWAEALEDTELALIPKENFMEMIHRDPEVAKKIIQLMAKNISEKEEQLLGLAYNSLRKKVAEALLMLRKKYQQTCDEKFVIDIGRESLSTIAGTATESLIRTLSDFRSENLIDIENGNIVIINQKKLEQLLN